MATLYGHVQCHTDANGLVQVGLRQLAEAMLQHQRLDSETH